MVLTVFFIISAALLLISFVFAFIRSKAKHQNGRVLDPLKILFLGAVLSAVFLFIPIYLNVFNTDGHGIFEAVFNAIYSMIRLFTVEGDFETVVTNLTDAPTFLYRAYTVLSSVLFLLIPFLTFGLALSFFKNASAYSRYLTHYNADTYIFSELNEQSLALAKSLHENNRSRFLVFTDVFDDEEARNELVESARAIGAVCFKKDIVNIDFSSHSKKSSLSFFAIGKDQPKNIDHALKLIEQYKFRENTNLYVFSTQVEGELLLTNAFQAHRDESGRETDQPRIKVRRVNPVQSLISRILYEDGYENIFRSAIPDRDGCKHINALVIGMGQHGTEMTKALPWFCQMTGYRVHIHAFDTSKDAQAKFTSRCPELMAYSAKHDVQDDAQYEICIHPQIDVDTVTFDELVTALPQPTYVFIALGTDEKNIATAVKLRSLFARQGYSPRIQAVVFNSEKKEALTGIANYRKQAYDIDFIGDMKTSCSEAVILDSDVEEAALARHLQFGKESDFWQFDYNYRSSVAAAIHHKMKHLCAIPGIEKAPGDRTPEERQQLRILEHCRWNAYMRSEGYVYGGTVEKSGRNDLAKMHNCLVPFWELPLEEQRKDDY